MDDQEMQLKVRRVSDKFTESMYVLANEPSVALYRLQEHVRRSLPELVQHKTDMQSWEEQSQGAIYTVEYACSAVKSMTNSSVYFKNIDTLLRQAITMKEQISNFNGRRFPNKCLALREALTRECITATSRIRIPEESMQALAMPVSISNIRSMKMDIAAEKEEKVVENLIYPCRQKRTIDPGMLKEGAERHNSGM
ncbi:hypothetical protein CCH79_00007328 [Gambusia affinis]|uniref:BLOC-1-related complex subunit 8 n=1 Tax=Gambusia affinis TaxID=33528 RepID=A0A315VDJ5_GAMAF|nr:hypothetical protein CCH79_00007328 [Gambusia affinis]